MPDSSPKWAKCMPVFRPKRRKNPTRQHRSQGSLLPGENPGNEVAYPMGRHIPLLKKGCPSLSPSRFHYHLCLIRLPLQGARRKPHSLNKTPSPSQKYRENDHKRRYTSASFPAIFSNMACSSELGGQKFTVKTVVTFT